MSLIEQVNAWLITMERNPEWIEVENRPWANENNRWNITGCQGYDFVMHDPRIQYRFFWNPKTEELKGSVHWDNRTEGINGLAHGATSMTIFDEILAYCAWRKGLPALTANVNINLTRAIPFNQALCFTACMDKEKSNGRKIYINGSIHTPDCSISYANALGLWIVAKKSSNSQAIYPELIHVDNDLRHYQHHHNNNGDDDNITQPNIDYINQQDQRTLRYGFNPSVAIQSKVLPEERLYTLPQPDSNTIPHYQCSGYTSSSLSGKYFSSSSLPPLPYTPQHYQLYYKYGIPGNIHAKL